MAQMCPSKLGIPVRDAQFWAERALYWVTTCRRSGMTWLPLLRGEFFIKCWKLWMENLQQWCSPSREWLLGHYRALKIPEVLKLLVARLSQEECCLWGESRRCRCASSCWHRSWGGWFFEQYRLTDLQSSEELSPSKCILRNHCNYFFRLN